MTVAGSGAIGEKRPKPNNGTSVVKLLSSKLILAAAAAMALVYSAHASAPAVGTWLSADGGTKVRVIECGGKLCGHVVWLSDPTGADGKPKTDKHNADAGKRARPLLGVQVVLGHDARRRQQMVGPDLQRRRRQDLSSPRHAWSATTRMNVQGCVLGILCKSQTWTRATDRDVDACATSARRALARALPEQHRLHFRIFHIDVLAQLQAERHAALRRRAAPSWWRASA